MNVSTCKGCGDSIVWMKTAAGKNIPVNAVSLIGQNQTSTFDPKTMIAHFSNCPKAGQFRKEK